MLMPMRLATSWKPESPRPRDVYTFDADQLRFSVPPAMKFRIRQFRCAAGSEAVHDTDGSPLSTIGEGKGGTHSVKEKVYYDVARLV